MLMASSLYHTTRPKLAVCGGEARASVLSSALHTRLDHGACGLLHVAPHERTHHGDPCTTRSGSRRHVPTRRHLPPATPPLPVRGSRRANHAGKRTAAAAPCRHPALDLGPPGGTMSFRHEAARPVLIRGGPHGRFFTTSPSDLPLHVARLSGSATPSVEPPRDWALTTDELQERRSRWGGAAAGAVRVPSAEEE